MNFLEDARERAGFTRSELARRSGVSRMQIIRIEEGRIGVPRAETVQRLAKGLGMDEGRLRAALVSFARKQGLGVQEIKRKLKVVR